MSNKMTKILLAGSNGFIGSHLSIQLAKQATISSIGYEYGPSEKDFINLDLTDIKQINDFAENRDHFDVLIFLVGLAHTKGTGKELPEFKKVNYQTLVNLLSVLADNNKVPGKIIFASTISVYGEKYNQNIYREDSKKSPFSPYAVTKLEAEQYLKENFGNRSWILRFAPVYSSDFFLNIDRRTKIGKNFYRVGKGSKKLSLCNVVNIKAAIEVIINGNVPAGIYNLSDPIEYSYNDLLEWSNAGKVIRIPQFTVSMLYYLGKLFNSTFIKENTVKLISDNIFPSDKIRSYIDFPTTMNDVKPVND